METARSLTLDTMIFSAPYGFGWQTNVFDGLGSLGYQHVLTAVLTGVAKIGGWITKSREESIVFFSQRRYRRQRFGHQVAE